MNSQLKQIVHADQYGFVPRRQMSTCSLTVLRLIDRFRSINLELGDPTVLTVFLDIAAAFDAAKHDALHLLLVTVFPNSNFLQLVQNLTTRGLACVSVNGFKSEFFMLTCGTGQGDPLSSPRFLICSTSS